MSHAKRNKVDYRFITMYNTCSPFDTFVVHSWISCVQGKIINKIKTEIL